jgi:hypothetical protein
MRWLRTELIPALLLGTACAGQPAAQSPRPDPAVADQLAVLATAVVESDGGTAQSDTLFAADAEVIADGHRRSGSPRFAGVGERGRVVVGSTRVDLVGEFAWAVLRYQWLSADENIINEGQATLVLLRQPGTRSWRVVHAHSSQSR